MIAMMIFKTSDECDACIYALVRVTGFEATSTQFLSEHSIPFSQTDQMK